MRCPNCGLENPKTAETCDCGFNFEVGKPEGATDQQETRPRLSFQNRFAVLLSAATRFALISIALAAGWFLVVFIGFVSIADGSLSVGEFMALLPQWYWNLLWIVLGLLAVWLSMREFRPRNGRSYVHEGIRQAAVVVLVSVLVLVGWEVATLIIPWALVIRGPVILGFLFLVFAGYLAIIVESIRRPPALNIPWPTFESSTFSPLCIMFYLLATILGFILIRWLLLGDQQSLLVVNISYQPGPETITIEDQYHQLTSQDITLIKQIEITGELRVVGFYTQGQGPEAKAIFILGQQRLSKKVQLQQPRRNNVVIYMQQGDHFAMFPKDAKTIRRTMTFDPIFSASIERGVSGFEQLFGKRWAWLCRACNIN